MQILVGLKALFAVPEILDANAEPTLFSEGRAMQYIKYLADLPERQVSLCRRPLFQAAGKDLFTIRPCLLLLTCGFLYLLTCFFLYVTFCAGGLLRRKRCTDLLGKSSRIGEEGCGSPWQCRPQSRGDHS